MSERKYFGIPVAAWACGLLIIAGLVTAYVRYKHLPLELSGDYASYIETAKLFNHLPGAGFFPQRILKPLNPIFVALIQGFLGSYDKAFFVQVYLLYAALILISFLFFQEFFEKKLFPAVFCTCIVAFGYPMLRYDLSGYTETGALLFFVAGLYGSLIFFKRPNIKTFILTALIISFGFLWKEYSAVNLIILGLIILFNKNLSRKQKMIFLVSALGIFALITGIWQLYVYHAYHYTYLDWYVKGGNFSPSEGSNYTLKNILKSLFGVLIIGWVFVLFSYKKFKELETIQRKFITLSLFPPFLFLFWGSVSSRLFYVIVPIASILVYLGARYIFPSKIWLKIILICIIASNFLWLLISMHVL